MELLYFYYCSKPTGRSATQLQPTCYSLHACEKAVDGVYEAAGALCPTLSPADQTTCDSSASSLPRNRLDGSRREGKFK